MIETQTGKKIYTDYEKGYKKGKEETIEEFANKILANDVIDKSVVRRIREQMKEEN